MARRLAHRGGRRAWAGKVSASGGVSLPVFQPTTTAVATFVGVGTEADLVGASTLSVGVVLYINSIDETSVGICASGRYGSISSLNRGWGMRIGATSINFLVRGTSSTISSPTYLPTVDDVGKFHRFVMTHDGSTVRMYHNGSEVGSGTSGTGFTVASGSDRLMLCDAWSAVGTESTDYDIVGFGIDASTTMSSGQVTTWDASVQADSDGMVQLPSGGIWWKAASWDGGTGASAWDEESTGTKSLNIYGGVETKATQAGEWA